MKTKFIILRLKNYFHMRKHGWPHREMLAELYRRKPIKKTVSWLVVDYINGKDWRTISFTRAVTHERIRQVLLRFYRLQKFRLDIEQQKELG